MTEALDGRVIVVTGAGSGIGTATARLLAASGARVFACDLKPSDEIRQQIRESNAEIQCHTLDVRHEDEVIGAIAACVDTYGRVDVAVNCAGIAIECPLLEDTVENFDRVIDVNLRGTYLVGREAIRQMVTQGGGGRVINIASDLGYLGRAWYSGYCASKGGVLALTRSWAREFAPDILVNCVAPGPIDTPMLGPEFMSPEVRATETNIPLARIGEPDEIAGVIAFLCGPRATFFTGQALGPNGGSVMP